MDWLKWKGLIKGTFTSLFPTTVHFTVWMNTNIKPILFVWSKYSRVQCNRLLRWCPSPDCSNAIKVAYVEAAPVTCRCGHTFCFACGENWHDPVRCCLLKKWIKVNKDQVTYLILVYIIRYYYSSLSVKLCSLLKFLLIIMALSVLTTRHRHGSQ